MGGAPPLENQVLLRKNLKIMNLAQNEATEISPGFFQIIRLCRIRLFRSQGRFTAKNHGLEDPERSQMRGCTPPPYAGAIRGGYIWGLQ